MGVGDVRNPCKCAGCSLQKGALNVGIYNLICHIIFVMLAITVYISPEGSMMHKQNVADSTGCSVTLNKELAIADTNVHKKISMITYAVISYILLPFAFHILLIYGALVRSTCICFVWIIYTILYILADIPFKIFACKERSLFWMPNWFLCIYFMWVLYKFREEIVLYGKVKLPLRVAKCPYYFHPPAGYDPRHEFFHELEVT